MAAAAYTTDLAEYGDVTSTTGWTEATSMTDTDGTGEVDSDLAIYGTQCYSESQRKSGLGSLVFTGTEPTIPTNGGFFIWFKFFAPNSLNTKTNGGIRMLIGSTSANYYGWYVNGSNTYPYGGWVNYFVDPETTGYTQTQGTPSGTWNTLGIGCNLINGISKGNSYTVDIMRYGRGETRITNGDLANGYATFDGLALVNDNATTGRWGLFQDVGGSYLFKGLMSLGLTATSVDFRDSNVGITIDAVEHCDIDFNRIEIHNTSSNVEWNSITITSLSTVSPGRFEMIDNATVAMDSCTFKDMDTFIFDTGASVDGSRFIGCNQITHGGADFDSCIFSGYEGTAGTAYMTYAETTDPDGELDNCQFIKGTASTHAIEFDATNTPTTITLRGIDFTDYNATNGNNDSALYFPSTTKSYTVNLVGCTGDISYRVGTGGSVTLVSDPVTLTFKAKDSFDNSNLQNARILCEVTSGVNFPYQASVSITGTGTTATVTHTAHGLVTGDYVIIRGANEDEYNAVYSITVTGVNTYTYTTNETIGTGTATGTITATFALLSGLTDINGEVSDSWSISNDQPFSYSVAKATTEPYFVRSTGTGTLSSTLSLTTTVTMVRDQ